MLLLCPRCGKVAILNVTSINAVSFLPDVYAVFSVFLTAQWRLWHTGSLWGLTRVFDYDLYRKTRACLFALYICATTIGPTSLSC